MREFNKKTEKETMKMRSLLLLDMMGLSSCDWMKPIDSKPPYCPASCYLSKTEKVAQDGWNTSYYVYQCKSYSGGPCPASAYPDMGTTSSPQDLSIRRDL